MAPTPVVGYCVLMNTRAHTSRFCLITCTAAALAFMPLVATNAYAEDGAAATNSGPTAHTSAGGAGTNSLARDRHDTVMSNEMRANTVGRDTDLTGAKLSRGDRRFIEKAAKNGMAESRIARLAVSRSSDPRVRSYAQQIVSDHEKVNAELNQLAARKGVSLASDDENDRLFKRLSDKNGSDFDERFVGHMADEHEDDIELFEKASRKSDDPEIAAFASKQLSVLQEHRNTALDIEKSLKGK